MGSDHQEANLEDRAAIGEVPRVGGLDRAAFERDFVEPARPVILQDAIGGWPALGLWTPEYLTRRVGAVRLNVAVAPEGRLRYARDGTCLYDYREMEVRQLLERALAPPADGRRFYAESVNVGRDLPALLEDVRRPAVLDQTIPVATRMWFGQGGIVTGLHYDRMHNLLAVVRGRKSLLLFPPSDLPYLYHCDLHAVGPTVYYSQVDPEAPDLERFPGFARAHPLRAELEPGEMLFLPAFWWHYVRSHDMNVAVNFWWLPFPQEVLHQMVEGLRALGSAFVAMPPAWRRYVATCCAHFFPPGGAAGGEGLY
jgi:hypothetical protein